MLGISKLSARSADHTFRTWESPFPETKGMALEQSRRHTFHVKVML